MSDSHEVPSNCLVIPCGEGYRVEFEAEASERDGGYEVWLSLFDAEDGKRCSSTSLVVPSLDQSTLKGVALGYAEGWDQG